MGREGLTGKVIKFDDRGFGFIQPDDGGEDVFVHSSALPGGRGDLQPGDRVEFDIQYDDRRNKDRAQNVKMIGGGGGGGRRRDDSRGRGRGGGRRDDSRDRGRRRSRSRDSRRR